MHATLRRSLRARWLHRRKGLLIVSGLKSHAISILSRAKAGAFCARQEYEGKSASGDCSFAPAGLAHSRF